MNASHQVHKVSRTCSLVSQCPRTCLTTPPAALIEFQPQGQRSGNAVEGGGVLVQARPRGVQFIDQARQTQNVGVRVGLHRRGISPCRQKSIGFLGCTKTQCTYCQVLLFFLLTNFSMRVFFQSKVKTSEDNLCWYFVEYLSPGGEMLRLRSRVRLRFMFAEPAC